MSPIAPCIVSKLIFCIATLRYFERQHEGATVKDSAIENAIKNEKDKIDEILQEIDCLEYKSRQTIYEQVLIDQLKQAI